VIRWVTILIACAGFTLAMFALTPTFPTAPDLPVAREPSVNPFPRGIASIGQVEAATRHVNIAPPTPGLVVDVSAEVGDVVKPGDVLLRLDDRDFRAELLRAEAGLGVFKAQIARWHALPRPEDIPPLDAQVAKSAAELADAQDRLARVESARREGAGFDREVSEAKFKVEEARATLAHATAELHRTKAGGWAPDLVVAEAELAKQEAQASAIRLQIERLTVRAPRAGTVLRRAIEPGEYAGGADRALMVLGNLSTLHVRALVDEEDIALVRPDAKAFGRTRGSVVEQFPLSIVRIEPLARPKVQLSGANSERVDTRVVEVVLLVQGLPGVTLYPGQAIDVYIDAVPAAK
jgi:multidrug efflux pump subunit AcrA (membrane-fusion protein)